MKRPVKLYLILFCFLSIFQNHAGAIDFEKDYSDKLITPEPILSEFDPESFEDLRNYTLLLKNIANGDSLFLSGKVNEAAKEYKGGLTIAAQYKLDWQSIILHCRLGFMYYWSANPSLSEKHYKASRQLINNVNIIKDTLAVIEILIFTTDKDEFELSSLMKSIGIETLINCKTEQFSDQRLLKYYFLRALYYRHEFKYDRVLNELLQADELINYSIPSGAFWQFLIRFQQTDYYYKVSDERLALEYLNDLNLQFKNKSEFNYFKYLLNFYYGSIYVLLKDYNQALKYFDEAYYKAIDYNHLYFANDQMMIGYVYQKLGLFKKARASYDQAEQIYKSNNVHDERLAYLYWYLASIARSMENGDAEFHYLNEAQLILQIYPDPVLEPYIVTWLGYFYYRKQEYSKSIFIYNQILDDLDKLLTDDSYFEQQYSYLIISDYIYLIRNRALSLYHLSKTHGFDKIPLQQSYQDYQNFLKLKLKIHDRLSYEKSKKTSLNEIRKAYDAIINVGYDLYMITENDSIAHELFTYTEKAKAHLLKSFISDELGKQLSGIPESIILESKLLQKEIDSLQYNLRDREFHESSKDAYVIDQLVNKIEEYDQFKLKMERDYPKYSEFKEDNQVVSLDQIQKKLKPDQALLEYHYTHNAFYIFFIDKNRFKLFLSPISRNFPESVLSYRKLMAEMKYGDFSKKTINEFVRQSNRLYQLMIDPVEELIEGKRLMIIPDGELILIPFESLIKDSIEGLDQTKSFRDFDYMVKSNPVSYLYSASQLLAYSRAKNKHVRIAGFAPEYLSTDVNTIFSDTVNMELMHLPGAIEEVSSLKQYYTGKAYIGSDATKKRFFRESAKSDIIHLAMHTFLDANEPMNSEFVFSSDNEPDKQLHAYEVYAHDIKARLMVLSACNTVTGEVVKGEGVFNIARAFFQAGVENVILTQWPVADNSSVALMDRFYYYLSEGHPVDVALQKTKLEFLMKGDPVKTQPFYWAPFVCYGTPTEIPGKNRIWLYIAGSILGISLILLLRLRFKFFTNF